MKRFAIAVCLVAGLVAGAGAREEIPAETREIPWRALLAACDDPSVLARIQRKFATTERRFWSNEVEIVGFDRIRQAAFRPHGLDLIPRRYCEAMATTSDRRRHRLRYAVIEDAGIIGMGYEVQYCLDGYDRNLTAPAGCSRLDR